MLAVRRIHGPLAVAVFVLAAAVSIPHALAGAQEREQQDYCANKFALYFADFSIEACSFLIMSGDKAPKDLAVIFGYRCRAYLEALQFGRALQDCNEAVWLDRNLPDAYRTRGLVHEQLSQFKRAVADFTQLIVLQPADAGAWGGLCRNELSLEHVRLAISACSESLRLRPGDATTHITRGLAYLASGGLDLAIADFNLALHAAPKLAAALYGRGIARLARQNGNDGEADIAAAKSIQSDIASQVAIPRRVQAGRGSTVTTSLRPDGTN